MHIQMSMYMHRCEQVSVEVQGRHCFALLLSTLFTEATCLTEVGAHQFPPSELAYLSKDSRVHLRSALLCLTGSVKRSKLFLIYMSVVGLNPDPLCLHRTIFLASTIKFSAHPVCSKNRSVVIAQCGKHANYGSSG